jgi:predicted DsbA family dithiol-disulfide isomerase
MNHETNIEILAFTDPVCTWCWGSEPVLRKLETYYGDAVHIRYVMGGLVKDIRDFYDNANDIGGDPERSNVQIARHWLEASARHGMPVRTEGFRLFSAETTSTYPQNIAFKAAELTDSKLAPRYLRRIREASASEARETGRKEVLIELANEAGLDVSTFIGHLNDGSAEKAFREDLETTRRYGVRGFPTFLFSHAGKELLLRGYQDFRAVQSVIDTLTGGKVQARAPESGPEGVLAFLQRYGRTAPIEVATVFGLTLGESEKILTVLANERCIHRLVAGNGYFWELDSQGSSCGIEDGVCMPNQ